MALVSLGMARKMWNLGFEMEGSRWARVGGGDEYDNIIMWLGNGRESVSHGGSQNNIQAATASLARVIARECVSLLICEYVYKYFPIAYI